MSRDIKGPFLPPPKRIRVMRSFPHFQDFIELKKEKIKKEKRKIETKKEKRETKISKTTETKDRRRDWKQKITSISFLIVARNEKDEMSIVN